MSLFKNKYADFLSVFILICLFTIAGFFQITSYALDTKISFSDPSATVGSEVNVTMRIGVVDEGMKLGKADIMLSYDAQSLEFISGDGAQGGAGSIKITAASAAGNDKEWIFSLKFKALKAGESTIKISTWEIQDIDGVPASASHEGSSKVTITEAQTEAANPGASGESSASAAETSQGVGAEISSENVVIDNKSYTVASSFDASLLPEGYTVGRYLYQGKDVAAGRTEISDIIVMYLIADDGSGGLFAYDEKSGNWSQFTTLTSSAKKITIVPLPQGVQVPQGFKPVSFETSSGDAKTKISGWVWASAAEHEYYIVYAMNAQGEKSFYRFDVKEKSFQRYFSDPAIENAVPQSEYDKLATNYNKLLKDYKLRGFVIIALAVIIVGLLAFIFIKLKKQTTGEKTSDKPLNTSASDFSTGNKSLYGEPHSRAKVKVIKREEIENVVVTGKRAESGEENKAGVLKKAAPEAVSITDFEELDKGIDKTEALVQNGNNEIELKTDTEAAEGTDKEAANYQGSNLKGIISENIDLTKAPDSNS